ncbi:hypothetical protein BVC80_41g60 [Macleaya cordata]|uniref:Uncharacterized protein n=1 Tax=Macleaya cordata TaxID=56857 RepID=A0A200QMU7_MACCD|nr:hypothetical protein BVC80_41g60 [Macleaya cordata]
MEMIPAAIIWCVWKERNARIFENMEETLEKILCTIKIQAFRWVSQEDTFKGCNLDLVIGRWRNLIFEPP